ncbi:MAG: hypothetical protein ACKOF9_02360, partial [Burkholderiales bacterium]
AQQLVGGVDGPGTGSQLSCEAVVQAGVVLGFGFAQIEVGEDLNYVEAVKKPLETVLKCLAREINASESRIRFDLNARRGSGTTEIEPSRVLR